MLLFQKYLNMYSDNSWDNHSKKKEKKEKKKTGEN